MTDLHDEIIVWRLHMANERLNKRLHFPVKITMPCFGEFIGE